MSSLPFPHTTTKKNVRYVSFTYTHTHRHLHLHCMNNQPSVISLKPFRKRKPFRSLYKTCCCKCLAVPTKTTMWCVSSCRLWSCWKKASVLYAQSVFYAALHKKASASCCRERGSLLWSAKNKKSVLSCFFFCLWEDAAAFTAALWPNGSKAFTCKVHAYILLTISPILSRAKSLKSITIV